MTANGFLEQKQASPLGFGTVVLLHGAAIAAVVMIKDPGWEREPIADTIVVSIEKEVPPPPPEPIEPLPRQDIRTPPPRSVISAPPPLVPTPRAGETVIAENIATPPGPVIGTNPEPSPSRDVVMVPPLDQPRNPVRVEALFDPRAGSQQPPYPSSEERGEREGQVRIRVTIGTDGRVTAVQRLAATNEAFWRATEMQARNRWRFRPATLDGRPVPGSKVITIHFRLDGR